MTKYCPSCADKICSPYGYSKDILLISEYPSKLDIKQGRPFASSAYVSSAGKILRKELSTFGVDLLQLRICNLWLHEPNKNENCFKAGLDVCLEEAKGKQAILLIGSEAVETFTGYKVSDVTGLQVNSPMLSAPIVYAMVNPAICLHKTLGETRFAIKNFVERLEEEGLL